MCMPGSVEWDSYCNRRKVKSSLWQQKRLPCVLDTEEALCPDSASLNCTKVFAPYVSWYIGLESFGQMAHKVQIGSSEPFSPLTALRNRKGQKFSPILCGDSGLETPCHHLHAPTHFPKASGISEVWCWKEKKKRNTCFSSVFSFSLRTLLVASHSVAASGLNWLQIQKGKEMQLTALAGTGGNLKEGCLCSQRGSDSSNFACHCPHIKCVSHNS